MTRTTRIACTTTAGLTLAALLVPVPGAAAAEQSTTPRTAAVASSSAARTSPAVRYAADRVQPPVRRLIVRMTGGAALSTAVRSAATGLAGGRSITSVRKLGTGSELVSLSTPLSAAAAWTAAKALQARADVAFAEPDLMMHALGTPSPVTPNDTRFGEQWDLWDSVSSAVPGGYSAKAPAAWGRTTGRSGEIVAVLDTGITDHPDLPSSSLTAGWDFVSADGPQGTYYVANDGDGRDSDPHDVGDWISVAENAGTADNGYLKGCGGENPDGSSSSSWHGTHVTGTIVGAQDDGLGISGIAPGVSVQPIRVLGKCGGYTSDISDAITWASGGTLLDMPVGQPATDPTPASVISMSLGGPGSCDAETQAAISGAVSRGTTVVVAAGNSGQSVVSTSPANGSSPANCAGVIDVEATDRAGHVASYSNRGVVAGSTVIAAPGGSGAGGSADILSTLNAGITTPVVTPGGFYADYAGTSMATPHVAAAVALMQSQLSTPLTPAQVAARLTSTATPFPASAGCTLSTCGPGLLDIGAAVASLPSAPAIADAGAADSAVDLSWTAASANGSAITGYHVQGQIGAGSWQDVVADTGSTATTLHVTQFADLTALVNGQTYAFRVSALNGVGEGTPTTTAAVMPSNLPAPGQPAAPAVAGGLERLDPITWTAPADGGSPITDYSLRYRRLGAPDWACATGTAPTCRTGSTTTTAAVRPWPSVMPAGSYEVQVAAVSAVGTGLYSPSGTAVVRALVQRATVTSTVLRPFRDGYQDSVRVSTTSNAPAHGTLRILNPSGVSVLTVPLATGTAWATTWTGLNAHRVRVPDGRYHVQVLLTGRSATTAQVGLLTVTVASSRATRPVISLSSTTVYPVVDKYVDTVTVGATATVPATFTWRIVRSGKTVWSKSFSRRLAARAVWGGTSQTGARLPAGTYSLVVVAKGGEGVALTSSHSVVISAKRLRPKTFTLTLTALQTPTTAINDAFNPDPQSGGGWLANNAIMAFAPLLPTTVGHYSGVSVTVCSVPPAGANTPGSDVVVGWLGSPSTYTGRPVRLGTAVGCYTLPTAPSAAAWSRAVHFSVGSYGAPTDMWWVSGFRVTGTRYYLG